MIPGANLLAMAMGPIGAQTLQHEAFEGRTVNSIGNFISTFAAPVDITGSMQPVNRKLYQQLGLNLSKDYATLYTQADVHVTDRDREGDRVSFGGKVWQAESDMDWRLVDGWRKILCVRIPSEPEPPVLD